MNVDVDNFHEVHKFIKSNRLIEKSQYICYDLEFTGVRFDNNERDKYDMFLNEKYNKMASVATRFNIIQVGLTFIVPKEPNLKQPLQPSNDFVAYPYNFYVFPRASSTHEPVISMQAGCIEFNTDHSMDWNRWIRKGITYVRMSEINKALQSISNSGSNTTTTITNSTSNTNNKPYSEILNQLTEKTRSHVDQILTSIKNQPVGFKYSLDVPKPSVSFIRRAIERYADERSINLMISVSALDVQEDEEDETSGMVKLPLLENINLTKLNVEVISEERREEEELRQRERILGFTVIFQEIWRQGKALIGHNCLYDLLFLYSSFVDELPKDYRNFKQMLCDGDDQNGISRRFYDTKYIAGQREIYEKVFKKGTSLDELYRYLNQNKFVDLKKNVLSLAPGFQAYDLNKPALHQAGFDSYLTSWIFLNLHKTQQDEGKLCIFKSYFFMNLRTKSDQIRKDLKAFVIAIVLNNVFIPYEELKAARVNMAKLIREQLFKQGLMNDTIVIDGFKEIFISPKEISKTQEIVKFLAKLKRNKIVNENNVISLERWIMMKAQAVNNQKVNQK